MQSDAKMTAPEEREAFYDTEIAPILIDLAKRCQDAGLSFVATAEWEPGEGGTTMALQAARSLSIETAMVAARSRNNVDTIIMHLMRCGSERGHSSMCLKILGVPMSPALTPCVSDAE